MNYGGYPEEAPNGVRVGDAQTRLYAKERAYTTAQEGVPTNSSFSERMNGLVNLAAAVSSQAEGVRGRLFGYGPPSLVAGSTAKEPSSDTIEDAVGRLSIQLEQALSTIGYLNSRL